MERRTLLKLAALVAVGAPMDALQRLTRATERWNRVDAATLDGAEELTSLYAQAYFAASPNELLVPVRRHADRLASLLDGGSVMLPADRQRLGSLTADAAAFAGSLELLADHRGDAHGWFLLAQKVSQEAHDPALHALALGSMSVLYSATPSGGATGNTPRARWTLRQANRQMVNVAAPTSARAWLAASEAEQHAAGGDAYGYFRAMERVDLDGDGPTREGFYSDYGFLSVVSMQGWREGREGLGLALLGHEDAEPRLREVLAKPATQRGRASMLADLATYHLAAKEPVEAATNATDSLEHAMIAASPAGVRRVRGLRSRMGQWADLAAVQELDEALAVAAA